jgi:hypothetical protein
MFDRAGTGCGQQMLDQRSLFAVCSGADVRRLWLNNTSGAESVARVLQPWRRSAGWNRDAQLCSAECQLGDNSRTESPALVVALKEPWAGNVDAGAIVEWSCGLRLSGSKPAAWHRIAAGKRASFRFINPQQTAWLANLVVDAPERRLRPLVSGVGMPASRPRPMKAYGGIRPQGRRPAGDQPGAGGRHDFRLIVYLRSDGNAWWLVMSANKTAPGTFADAVSSDGAAVQRRSYLR